MICPDWRLLADHRDHQDGAADRGTSAGWDEAVAHFDAGCPQCRRAALAAEPTLVFRGLRVLGQAEMSPAREAAEVDAVRQAVAAMRTASRVDSIEGRTRRSFHTPRSAAGWMRWAAAASLTLVALTLPVNHGNGRPSPVRAAMSAPQSLLLAPVALAGEADLPIVEGVNRPGARVYHMNGEGLSVVMIVDETLDV
jgi:hypothetical protein